MAARSAVLGAYLNVKINAAGLKDRSLADGILAEAAGIAAKAQAEENDVLETVEKVING